MAKLKKQISGYSIRQITAGNQRQINKYTIEELSSIMKSYARTANRRLNAIEKANLTEASSAYRYVKNKSYDHFEWTTVNNRFRTATKGRSYEEIFSEIVELNEFLFKAKTSTVKGTKDYINDKINKSIKALESDEKYSDLLNKLNKALKEKGEDNFGNFWRESAVGRLVSIYGSDVAVETFENIKDKVNSKRKDDEKVNDDYINDLILKYLEENEVHKDQVPILLFENQVADEDLSAADNVR